MKFHFWPKIRKRKSPDNISVLFSFSCIQSPSQPYNAPPIPRPVSPFLQVVLVDGVPLSSCTVYRYLCGIFLDDISTREQFAFLVYCYRVKAIFYNLCTVLYWRLCGVRRSTPIRLQFDRATTTVRYGLPVSSRTAVESNSHRSCKVPRLWHY